MAHSRISRRGRLVCAKENCDEPFHPGIDYWSVLAVARSKRLGVMGVNSFAVQTLINFEFCREH
jgi:hypothetical protein